LRIVLPAREALGAGRCVGGRLEDSPAGETAIEAIATIKPELIRFED
jgi:hypothetical protein